MLLHILALLIGIAVQTVFLFIAFWAMIKFQDLNYTFPKLILVAAFVASLDQVLRMVVGHYLGFFLSNSIVSPIIFIASFIGIKKVTEADQVDVMFTVAVGNALCFALNMWLIGMLMGDLRPADRHPSPADSDPSMALIEETNSEPVVTNSTAAAVILKQLTIKGATQNGDRSSASISDGNKIYTIYSGSITFVPMNGKLVPVKLKKVDAHSLTLDVNGETVVCPY